MRQEPTPSELANIKRLELGLADLDDERRREAAKEVSELPPDVLRLLLSDTIGWPARLDWRITLAPFALAMAAFFLFGGLHHWLYFNLAIVLSQLTTMTLRLKVKRFGRRRFESIRSGLVQSFALMNNPNCLAPLFEAKSVAHILCSYLYGLGGQNNRENIMASIDDAVGRIRLNLSVEALRGIPVGDLRISFERMLANPYADVPATVRALELIGDLGDSRLVDRVRKLAEAGATTPNMFVVRNSARACLNAVAERASDTKDQRTLLRASVDDEVSSGTLLRSVAHVDETPAAQLLRPGQ